MCVNAGARQIQISCCLQLEKRLKNAVGHIVNRAILGESSDDNDCKFVTLLCHSDAARLLQSKLRHCCST